MRRNAFLLILLFNVGLAQAQLLIGPVIGTCVSQVSYFDSQPRYSSVPSIGFDGGIMASMKVKKKFRLNAQLLYAYRTKNIHGTDAPRTDKLFRLTSSMNYIEMPIYYALEFKNLTGDLSGQGGQTKTYNWFIGAGPVISYWLSERGTLQSTPLLEVQIPQIDYTTRFGQSNQTLDPVADVNIKNVSSPNRFQFGINITGGISFEPVGLHKIITSVQLTLVQTFFSGDSNGYFVASPDDIDVLKSRNNNIRFSVAYLFDTKVEKRKKGKSTSNVKIPKKKN